MSVIHRSNVPATGPTLGLANILSKTPAELYAEYAARVGADGGTVHSPSDALAAIEAAIAGGYYADSLTAYSLMWGRKLAGANLAKLYCLFGHDALAVGIIPVNDTGDYPSATPAAGATLRTPVMRFAKSAVSGYALSAVTRRPASATSTYYLYRASDNVPASGYTLVSSGVQTGRAFSSTGVLTATQNTAPATIHDAQTLHMGSVASREFGYFQNGLHVAAQLVGADPYDMSATDGYFGAPSGATPVALEFWAMKRSTVEMAQLLSFDQKARFPTP